MRYDAPLVEVEDLFPTRTTGLTVDGEVFRPFGLTLATPVQADAEQQIPVFYSADMQVSVVAGDVPAVFVEAVQPLMAKKQKTTMDHQTWDDELPR
jgi:hypothetical protein